MMYLNALRSSFDEDLCLFFPMKIYPLYLSLILCNWHCLLCLFDVLLKSFVHFHSESELIDKYKRISRFAVRLAVGLKIFVSNIISDFIFDIEFYCTYEHSTTSDIWLDIVKSLSQHILQYILVSLQNVPYHWLTCSLTLLKSTLDAK